MTQKQPQIQFAQRKKEIETVQSIRDRKLKIIGRVMGRPLVLPLFANNQSLLNPGWNVPVRSGLREHPGKSDV